MSTKNHFTERDTLRSYVDDLLHIQDTAGFTEWEIDFVNDMARTANLEMSSAKQKAAIFRMVEKYGL